MTDPEYKRGYAKGRSKTEAEMQEVRAALTSQMAATLAFKRAVFIAALPCVIERPWTKNGAAITSLTETVSVAVDMAEEAARRIK